MMTSQIYVLINNLNDESREIRDEAKAALVAMGAEAVPALMEYVKNYRGIKLAALFTLAEIGEPAVEPMFEMFQTGDLRDKSNAAIGLGELQVVRAIDPMIDLLLQSLTVMDFRHFSLSLVKIGQPAIDRLVERYLEAESQKESDNYLTIMTYRTQQASDILLKQLETIEETILRRKTMWAIAELSDQHYFDLFSEWIVLQDDFMRIAGAHGLRRCYDPYEPDPKRVEQCAEGLSTLIHDSNVGVRRVTALALCWIDHPKAIEALKVMQNDEDEQVSGLAGYHLSRSR
jgi:HEAT repeat protein